MGGLKIEGPLYMAKMLQLLWLLYMPNVIILTLYIVTNLPPPSSFPLRARGPGTNQACPPRGSHDARGYGG